MDIACKLGVKTYGVERQAYQDYTVNKKTIGEGAFGKVKKATCKSDNGVRAIKEIRKKSSNEDRRGMAKDTIACEVASMGVLDHPHIIRLYEVYQDLFNIYLVMDFCSGGDLCDAVQAAKNFTEKDASCIMQQVIQGVAYMHNKLVCHRDLKPDNFLLQHPVSQGLQDNSVKIVDFGCAWTFSPGEVATRKVGSQFYIAPEVLAKSYTNACDLWSCGVTAYILLCGYPPFRNEVAIRSKELVFPEKEWGQISDDAKELTKRLIERNPKKRETAEKILRHRWIMEHAPKAKQMPLQCVQENLASFADNNAMKKAALSIVARNLSGSQIEKLRETFLALDKNQDGTISKDELEQGLKSTNLGDNAKEVLQGLDMNGDGTIEYTEFLAGSLEKKQYSEESACWAAFKAFDADSTGSISRAELANVLEHEDMKAVLGGRSIDEVFADCDKDHDGVIEFDEFMAMMRS